MAALKYKDKNGQWKNIASGGSNSGGGNANVDLSGYATKQELDNKVDKVSGKQLSTEDFTTVLLNKLNGLSNYDDTAIQNAVNSLQIQLNTLVSGDANTAIESFNEIIAFLEGVEDTQTLEGIIAGIEQQIAGKQATISDLADIRSGAALGKTALQTVPSEYVTETELANKGYATASALSLGLADKQNIIEDLDTIRQGAAKGATALQSYTEQFKGTVTGVKINGSTKYPFDGIVDIGNVITSHQDISGKQDKLVSGTNIKTVNGESILGSGNITIEGSSPSSVAYPVVNHGTNDTTFVLTPNTFHIWGEISSIDLSLGDEINGVMNEYLFQFTCGSALSTITFPENIRWKDVEIPEFRFETTYRISIINGFGVISAFDNPNIVYFYANRSPYSFLYLRTWAGLTWEQWVNREYNTPEFVIEDGKIWYNSAKQYELLDTDPTDVIIPGHTYEFEYTD